MEVLSEKSENSLVLEPIYQKLVTSLQDYLKNGKEFSSQFFFSFLPAELKEAFNRLYLIDFGEKIEERKWASNEIQKTEIQLQTLAIKAELQKAIALLREKENAQQDDLDIRQKVLQLTKNLSEMERKIRSL